MYHTPYLRRQSQCIANRKGSTLLIVVALLGMLAFLGFMFYTFAAQERVNAVAFSQEAKVLKAPSLEPDALFDFALQQIILGPPDSNVQSILWGGRHSLLANMFGRDGVAWNGEGVNLRQANGQPQVDMNFDDTSSGVDTVDNPSLLDLVDGPAANPSNWNWGSGGVYWGFNKRFRGTGPADTSTHHDLPEPDVNYNSPDINSLFLSYDGIALDSSGGNPTRVIIPSFLRPQYLRTAGAPTDKWYSNNTPGNQIMRPHAQHMCVVLDNTGGPYVTNQFRYVDATQYKSLNLQRPFTFNSFEPETVTRQLSAGNLGVWNNAGMFQYDLDVDTDGDGIMDAILMDLGHPATRRGDGKLVVPLFAISVRDLNGLLNVNATGSIPHDLNMNNLDATNQLGFRKTFPTGTYAPAYLTKSNLGLSTYEINIQRALTADPSSTNDPHLQSSEAALQLRYLMNLFETLILPANPGNSITELANLEWLMLNIGRANFNLGLAANSGSPLQNAIMDLYPGRFGEVARTRNFLSTRYPLDAPSGGTSISWTNVPQPWTVPPTPTNWSTPGMTAPDDNNNFAEGGLVPGSTWVQPLDFSGAGQRFRHYNWGGDNAPGTVNVDDDGNGVIDDFSEEGFGDDTATPLYGKYVELYRPTSTSPFLWPTYSGFHNLDPNNYLPTNVGQVKWGDSNITPIDSAKLVRGFRDDRALLDDPTETIVDPTIMRPSYSGYSFLNSTIAGDAVFGPDEMQFLQGNVTDGRLSHGRSRLAELMPLNLVESQNASDIRKRLTTVSSDRREFGIGVSKIGGLRTTTGQSSPWEVNPQFPPTITSSGFDPYRQELFMLLHQDGSSAVNNLNFRLNVNRLLTNNGTQLQVRQLTTYASASYPSAPANLTANNDRQFLARDIYTLLFTLCLGTDVDYRLATVTASQAREMAQFAVNVVDELDTDDVITAFRYDSNLSDGWTAPGDAVVYGVERQLLAFSESLAIRVSTAAGDSKMTIFDDTKTDANNGRRYVYFELQNVTPMKVSLANSSATSATSASWRVSMADTAGNITSSVHFLNGVQSQTNPVASTIQIDTTTGDRYLPPGALFTVGSQDGSDAITSGGTDYRTSDFRADITSPLPTSNNDYERIAPKGGAADSLIPTASTGQANFPVPACDLDLVWNYNNYLTNAFVLTPSSTAGAFAGALGDKSTTIYQLILERQASDGTWVAVDKTKSTTTANIAVITPQTGANDTDAKVTSELGKANSWERLIPLQRKSEILSTAVLPRQNSLKSTNYDPGTPFLWQNHNDRDFGTTAELFQIPLYGPDRLTDGRLGDHEFVDRVNLDNSASSDPLYPASSNAEFIPTVAAARFLKPHNPDQANGASNRWYRLLALLEIPNRSHQHPAIASQAASTTAPANVNEPFNLPIGFGWPRIHGQLNLNMIRNPQTLAALLDDDSLINASDNLLPGIDENSRQWWLQFLKARDSRFSAAPSPYAADSVTQLYVPGTGNARPFRSLDALGPAASSTVDSPLENTILRALPWGTTAGSNPNEYRRLFEVGTAAEHFGTPVAESSNVPLHSLARYRLLSKLMNNSTTRSNSFAVFVTVQYYEAALAPSGVNGVTATRIGGRLDDTPIHRGFFVVDRTGAIEQMKRMTTNPVSAYSYSFQPDTNRTGNPNGIRWKDLVLYRQTLN